MIKKIAIALLIFASLSQHVTAQDIGQDNNQEMLIAGFAFAGDDINKAARFPFTTKIDEELKRHDDSFSLEINKRLLSVKNKDLKIVTGRNFSTKNSDSPLNGVMVLTGETVLVESYGAYWKVFINLRGDALLFDYKGKKILKTYPLNLAIFDAVEGTNKPTNDQIQKLIADNIRTTKKEGLISQFLENISHAKVGNKTDKIFQVGNINIKPDALAQFPEEVRSSQTAVKDIIADSISSELSAQTNISLMPAKFNGVVSVMTIQLEDNSEQIELKIGDGDYIFNIDVNKLAKAKQQQTNTEISYLYGVNASIQVVEPLSQVVFLDSVFRNGAVSISPINKVSTDDFPAYYDVINGLFKKFSIALKTKEYGWVKTSTGSDKTPEQMTTVSNLIEKKGN